jgi:hypothetical protein
MSWNSEIENMILKNNSIKKLKASKFRKWWEKKLFKIRNQVNLLLYINEILIQGTHYSWTSLNGGTCYLRNGTVNRSDAVAVLDPFKICGIVSEGVDWRFGTFARGCDWLSPNIMNVSASSAGMCQSRCGNRTGCTLWSWSPTTGLCTLRRGIVDKSDITRSSTQDSVCGFNSTGNLFTVNILEN